MINLVLSTRNLVVLYTQIGWYARVLERRASGEPGLLLRAGLYQGFRAALRVWPVRTGGLAAVARCYSVCLGGGALSSKQQRVRGRSSHCGELGMVSSREAECAPTE